MKKIAFFGSIASIVALFFSVFPQNGESGNQTTYGQSSPAIGTVHGDVNIGAAPSADKEQSPKERGGLSRQSGSATEPSNVESMWVFYQDATDQSPSGCLRPPNADPIAPAEFQNRVGEFISDANATGSQLIITEYSPSRGWDAAASQIRVNGKALISMTPYWCNQRLNYGYLYK